MKDDVPRWQSPPPLPVCSPPVPARLRDAGRRRRTLTQHVLPFNQPSHKFVRIIRHLSPPGVSEDKNSRLKKPLSRLIDVSQRGAN